VLQGKQAENSRRVEHLNHELFTLSVQQQQSLHKGLQQSSSAQGWREANEKLVGDLDRFSSEIKILNNLVSDLEQRLDEKAAALLLKDSQLAELKTMLME